MRAQLYIDNEALSALALVQEGLISPVVSLMGSKEASLVDHQKSFDGVIFPFSFILAPRGKRNHEVLQTLQKDQEVALCVEGKEVGSLVVDEVFKIDPKERLINIYGTCDPSHPGVKNTLKRLGEYAVSGKYHVEYQPLRETFYELEAKIQQTGAKKIAAMMLAANPLNRAHEKMIRDALGRCDLLVIFLRKPFVGEGLSYELRYKTLKEFIDNYLPQNKVIVLPFENSYIFAGYNELILDALVAKNYGCNQLIVGKNHAGLGLFYDKNRLNTIFDYCKELSIEIKTIDEYVYCDTCKTLVSTNTCPHGQHHHIHYHSNSILQLLEAGVVPPPLLVRKEASAAILTSLYPNRFKELQQLHYSLMPGSGLLEQQSQEQFYIKLTELYQTTSLN